VSELPSDLVAFDAVPLGLAVVDAELNVVFWNQCLEDWTGISRGTAMARNLAALAPVWAQRQYPERISQLLQGGPPVVFSPQLHPGLIPGNRVYNVKASALPRGPGTWLALLSVEDITTLSHRIDQLRRLQRQSDLLLREIHHRVKNNLNMISGLIGLQADRSPAATARTLEALQGRILAISQVHDVLYHTEDLVMGRACDYLGPLAQLLNTNLAPTDSHRLVLDLDPELSFDLETTIHLGLIQTELMTNAMKYGLREGRPGVLEVSLRREEGGLVAYAVSHSGDTLASDFDPSRSQGLGMQLLVAYSGQLGARFSWEHGDPTRFVLRFRR